MATASVDTAAAALGEVRAAGEAFGLSPVGVPELRWGALMAELDPSIDPFYVAAVELIYEGYLFHYGVTRLCPSDATDRGNALLAGDFFYAHGLQAVAVHGDVSSVDLLSRLMAACSYLRSIQAPFAADDALWAYTIGGLVALQGGAHTAALLTLFDELEAAWAAGHAPEVRVLARDAAARLLLPEASALEDELAGDQSPSAGSAEPLSTSPRR